MQVFKLCLKILKKNILSMLIYFAVFLGVSLIMSSSMTNERQKENLFNQKKSNVAFISEENSPLIDGFKQELGKIANFVELPNETHALQDALFFRSVSYILRIPEGFTEDFMDGKDVQIEKTVVPDSFSNAYVDLAIDRFLNIARLYVRQIEGISQESLIQRLKLDLSGDAYVEMKAAANDSKNIVYSNYYYNYLAYTLLSVLILGMATLMTVLNDNDLKKRNACSPLSSNRINMQFILAILLFALVSWLIMVAFCLVFNYKNGFNMKTVYFILNSFVFAVCGASISFLIGNLVKGRDAIPAVNNVVTLGLSFISGVYVPQELLGSFVLRIASFTPTYWYVKANNTIAEMAQLSFTHMEPVISSMLIQACFALAFFAVALVMAKKNKFS